MSDKAKNIQEAAMESAASITDDDKRYIQLHIGYSYHHFGYGLYLRNQYSYLLDNVSDWSRDELGEDIYYRILLILFPEFKEYEKYISRITRGIFDDLNANYYLKFGKNFIADVTPDEFFLFERSSEIKTDDIFYFCKKYGAENKEYALAIAEKIWEIDKFTDKARLLGYSTGEINKTHRFCRRILKTNNLFVPLEILFAKNATPDSIAAVMELRDMFELLFRKSSDIKALPSYFFENREIVRFMLSCKGSLLEFAKKFSGDRELVMIALRNSVNACNFMSKSLWGDYEIAEETAKNSKYDHMFSYEAFEQFNDDDHIVRLALEANGANICYASERIRADYDMAVFALTHQKDIYPNSAFPSLSPELRNRKDLAMLELKSPKPFLDGFGDVLFDDDDIAMELIRNENLTWMFYKMSKRIKLKYLDKLPERIRNNVKADLQYNSSIQEDDNI